ncbi:DUF1153 domain-containing protein [Jannaschia aquimarina]|uniref:DUF1153 domain-containing protein n=1 Tax=Jannaschia aquimarina TaxID=935700 RepID=A0A0D1EMQ0_9RHOB|nr:DUF1153 domain-containing protein [Jannaschia aquimarina]KIT16970.1 hypothetical protein jaqu_12830 [Jannaschia aquimarina]SNT33248.1 Protein of unknown function [Jannaschia aquimarina]
MFLRKGAGPRVVTLPNGVQMSRADLPPAGTTRWVARRKAAVVMGVESGLMPLDEALERYDLSEEEYESWAEMASRHGTEGLKTTQLQRFRERDGGDAA